MTQEEFARFFDADYFAHGCGEPYERSDNWLNLFDLFAERIIAGIGPKTVLDAGCAMGFLVEKLREKGVEAYGVDLSDYAISQVQAGIRDYCWVGSITDPFPQKYDLIVSIEVVEHLPARQAEAAIANLCRYSDDILFSSSPFDYKESTHFSVRPPEAWAELFARQGFYRDVDFDASFITPWATRYRRKEEPVARVVREYERKFWLLWKENTDLREASHEIQQARHEASHFRQAYEQVDHLLQEREHLLQEREHLLQEREHLLQEREAQSLKASQIEQELIKYKEMVAQQQAYINAVHRGKVWRLIQQFHRLKERLLRQRP